MIEIFIPTYNRAQLLKRAVASVLQETRVPLVLKIYDNASTDETEAVVREFMAVDSRIVYQRHSDNIGGEANFIAAIYAVDNDYYVPLADDDWLLPDFLFEAYQIIQTDLELGAVVYTTVQMTPDDTVTGYYPQQPEHFQQGRNEPAQSLVQWFAYGHISWSSILWAKRTIDHVGYPYFHTGLPSDIDFQLQIISKFPIYFVNKPGAVFLSHPNQASAALFSHRNVLDWSKIIKRLDDVVTQHQLIPLNEYLPKRTEMLARYRNAWRSFPTRALEPSEIIDISFASGFILNDWELAFHLFFDYINAMGFQSLEINDSLMSYLSVFQHEKIGAVGFMWLKTRELTQMQEQYKQLEFNFNNITPQIQNNEQAVV